MLHAMRLAKSWLACLVLLALAGCASAPKPTFPVPRVLEISVKAAADINPDIRNRPAPLVLRVYELKSPVSFQSADFFALFDKDQATLGADLVRREEVQVRPGDAVKLNHELKADTRAVGVVAAFRDLEKSRWRAVVLLPDAPAPVENPPAQPLGVPVTVKIGARDVQVSQP